MHGKLWRYEKKKRKDILIGGWIWLVVAIEEWNGGMSLWDKVAKCYQKREVSKLLLKEQNSNGK